MFQDQILVNYHMKKFLFALIVLFSFQLAIGQNSSTKVPMLESNWNVPEGAVFEKFDNRETLVLTSGRATVKNQEFSNGTIEVDIYSNSVRSFAGITFRKRNDNMEEVYMRMHKSNQVDAIQYTPIFNDESNWQLYREYQARVSFKNAGWNSLRIEINNGTAVVFANNEEVLTIDNLRTDQNTGEIGLFALFTNRFSNFRFVKKDAIDAPLATESNAVDPNVIKQWKISNAKAYNGQQQEFNDFLKEEYTTVQTEESGLLPISKYVKKYVSGNFQDNQQDYIVALTSIESDSDQTKLFSFDYSDKIIVYLNGKAVFKGDNSFRAKGIQYMGHIAINANKLLLPLKKGINTIHCVVIEKANGWGLIAKLE